MKFTDGYWMLRPGVTAAYPAEVLDVETGPDSLVVYAPGYPLCDRGDLLKGPSLTVELGAPAADVIRVSVTHFAGADGRGPDFGLLDQEPVRPQVVDDAAAAALTSGELTARVAKGEPWRLDFLAGGRRLTGSGTKALAIFDTADGQSFVREQLDLGVGQFVYGLGERFGPVVKNGQTVDIWNADGGTASEQAYKNVPFFLTNAGYGIFVNHPGHVSFEVGSEAVHRIQFSVAGQRLEYFVIYGPTPLEILRKYTALTGRPARVPAWSYGLWLSTSFTTSYDEATVTSFIEEMAARDLPLSVFHFDTFWMREYRWCDFEWDPRAFPDPRGMIARLRRRGLRICVWINPYASKLDALLDMGVDCFKTDFGERIPTDAVYFDGSDPERMHNYYTYLYNQTVFELLRKRRGDGEAIVFARSATAGSQSFPVHWGGDCESSFEAMAESLRGGLSLGMSGFGLWSHDIGGFEGTPDPAVFKRWIAFGLLSSHSRLHGSHSYRVPWQFDEESVDVLRRFTKLKATLMPYLFEAGMQAVREGAPVMRAMALEFPGDPACAHLEQQYMLGGDLLVAPVFTAEGDVSYYVPEGVWTHLETGRRVRGPRWVTEQHDFLSVPLLARPGSVIPLGSTDDRPDYDYAADVTLRISELDDGARVETSVPALDGSAAAQFTTTREGGTIRIAASSADTGRQFGWSVRVSGVHAPVAVDGGVPIAEDDAGPGVRIKATGMTMTITV